ATSTPTVQAISFEQGILPVNWSIPSNSTTGWTVDNQLAQDGSYSLVSQTITPYQYAYIEFTAEFAPGTLSFWQRSDNGICCSSLQVYIDGNYTSGSNSVSTDWTQRNIPITAGQHTIRFRYSSSSSLDNVRLDNLRFIIPD